MYQENVVYVVLALLVVIAICSHSYDASSTKTNFYSSKAQDDPSEFAIDHEFDDYNTVLRGSNFFGSWNGYSSPLSPSSGFCYLDTTDYGIELTLYNGEYIDDGYVNLSFNYTYDKPLLDKKEA